MARTTADVLVDRLLDWGVRVAKVKVTQALHVAEALARGEPNRGRIALTLFRDKIHDLMAHDDRREEKARG